ncbi:MAG: hypothetical protein EBT73_04015 [Actinobacteria bacterium]|nr:hypothetical protein [Actinomycetota bacterium]
MTSTTHPPLDDAARLAVVHRHRDDIAQIFASYDVTEVRILDSALTLRRRDLFDVEFVAALPRRFGYGGLGELQHRLESLLEMRVHVYELFVDCQTNRTAREESKPL